jgi:hypothetical protein
MTGVIVEANPKLIAGLHKGRPRDIIVHAAVTDSDLPTATLSVSPYSELSSLDRHFSIDWSVRGQTPPRPDQMSVEEVPAIRVNALIERYMPGASPSFVSIDVEGPADPARLGLCALSPLVRPGRAERRLGGGKQRGHLSADALGRLPAGRKDERQPDFRGVSVLPA